MKDIRPHLKDIERIVINRTAVWMLDHPPDPDEPPEWEKVAGGPGFQQFPQRTRHYKDYRAMYAHINALLARSSRTCVFANRDLVVLEESFAYKWWRSGDTLNIVRKDLPARK